MLTSADKQHEVKILRRLSSRLFHIPMLVMLSLVAAVAGVLFLTGQDHSAATAIAVLAFLFYLLYGLLVIPRMLTRPAKRLVEGTRALVKGDPDISWGEGFSGELLELRTALEPLSHAQRGAGAAPVAGVGQASPRGNPVLSLESVASQLFRPTRAVTAALEKLAAACGGETRSEVLSALDQALRSSGDLARVAENLREFSGLEVAVEPAPEEFLFCEVMAEVGSLAEVPAEEGGATLLFECDDSLGAERVFTDRALVGKLLHVLVADAVAAAGEGNVTVLASLQKEGVPAQIELCIAHTLRWDDTGEAEDEPSAVAGLAPASAALLLARACCNLLSGTMDVDDRPGKGRVVTIWLPARVSPSA